MAFFRKAGNILGRTASNYISQEISSSKPYLFQAIRCMSSSKLFIGGLSYSTDDTSLREAFNKYGDVAEARVIVDRESGRSRGFGFITFASVEEASAAIQALDQQELDGRRIRVDYANDRVRGYGGGDFRGGNFGGGYNSGGFGGSYGGDTNDGYGGGHGGSSSSNSNSYGGGNLSYGGDGQHYSSAGQHYSGAGGGDNYLSGGAGGYGDKFGGERTNYSAGADEGFGEEDENYRDDGDAPDNYADSSS